MKITVLTIGSTGDVRPLVALAVGLRDRGHEVTVATQVEHQQMVTDNGLSLWVLPGSIAETVKSNMGRRILSGRGLTALRLTRQAVKPLLCSVMDACWASAKDADALVYHPLIFAGAHIAEKLGIPSFRACPQPMATPTGQFPNPLLGGKDLGCIFNRLTHLVPSLVAAPYLPEIVRWRKRVLKLRGWPTSWLRHNMDAVTFTLYCFSRHLVPRPPEWPSNCCITGTWFLDQESIWRPSPELVEFLHAGPPPVYVGFGSMLPTNSVALTKLFLEALQELGIRAILATGWGGMVSLPAKSSVFFTDEVPHEWLFPKVSAVIHHGGSGTLAMGLRFGKPTLVCPFTADQSFWGRIVFELGLGPKPVPIKRLCRSSIKAAIRSVVSTHAMAHRAVHMSGKIRSEEGVVAAVQCIECNT